MRKNTSNFDQGLLAQDFVWNLQRFRRSPIARKEKEDAKDKYKKREKVNEKRSDAKNIWATIMKFLNCLQTCATSLFIA